MLPESCQRGERAGEGGLLGDQPRLHQELAHVGAQRLPERPGGQEVAEEGEEEHQDRSQVPGGAGR